MKKNILLTITIAALTLAACNDDASDNTAASAIPLQITAVVQNGTTTRGEIVEVSQFANGNSIGVTGGKDSNGKDRTNVQYKFDGEKWSSDNPIYYQDKEDVEFKAYYPYIENATYEGVEAQDFLFAAVDENSTSNVNTNMVKFTFKHKMSKIALTFAKGTGVTDDDNISECYIGGVYTTGTFDTTKGEATAETNGNRDFQETNFDKESLTASTILYPQTAGGTDGIYVVVKVNNVNYKTTLIAANSKLESGNVYRYTVTINKTGLTVTSSTEGITGWETASVTDPIEAGKDIETFNDPDETRLYDLVFSDGSFMHLDADDDGAVSDEELSKLETMSLSDVVGIVLWTGNPIDTEPTKTFQYAAPIATVSTAYPKYVLEGTTTMNTYDPILAKEYPTCTHGLILGIKKANGGTGYMWQWGSSITTTFKTEYISTKYQTVIDGMASPNYLLIDGSAAENTTYVNSKEKTVYEHSDYTMIAALHNLSRFMGYNNTKVMEAYASYKKDITL